MFLQILKVKLFLTTIRRTWKNAPWADLLMRGLLLGYERVTTLPSTVHGSLWADIHHMIEHLDGRVCRTTVIFTVGLPLRAFLKHMQIELFSHD